MPLSLLAELEQVAATAPNDVALVEEDGDTVTYRQLADRVKRIAVALQQNGMQRGDRVLFAIRPSTTAIAAILAIMEVGAVLVAAQLGVGDAVFSAQMRLVQPQWLMAESVIVAIMRHRFIRALVSARGLKLPSISALENVRVIAAGNSLPGSGRALRLERMERGASAGVLSPSITNDGDDALIVFTSGTTDKPKAVVHTRASLTATLDVIATEVPVACGDHVLTRDLHLVIPALRSGATVHLVKSEQPDAPVLLDAIERNAITHLFEVTANLERVVALLEKRNQRFPSTLKVILVGAAPVRHAFFSRLAPLISPDTRAWCVYGMTEMLPVAAIELKAKLAYDGTGDIVGAPVRDVTARIGDNEELIVSGPHLFNRYLGSPPVESHATGDLARIVDNRVVLLGRSKDMIIRGAVNIYPALHEPVVEQIAGVRRCAMIGMFNEAREDERVVLVIEPASELASASDKRAFVDRVIREMRDGAFRIDDNAFPDEIVIACIPVSGRSSKVDKAALRHRLRTGALSNGLQTTSAAQ